MITNAPALEDVLQFATERPRDVEVVGQSLYDFQEYPAAGRSEFEFFSTPVGQGVSAFAAARSKTFGDTNMEAPKMLPQGVAHLATALYVQAYRGAATQQEYAFQAVAGANAVSNIQDTVSAILETGALSFVVGSKPLLQEAKLARFPLPTRLAQDGALATNSGTAGMINAIWASARGAVTDNQYDSPLVYVIDPPILIPPQQAFTVQIKFLPPIATLTSSSFLLGVFLDGYRYRYAQ